MENSAESGLMLGLFLGFIFGIIFNSSYSLLFKNDSSEKAKGKLGLTLGYNPIIPSQDELPKPPPAPPPPPPAKKVCCCKRCCCE